MLFLIILLALLIIIKCVQYRNTFEKLKITIDERKSEVRTALAKYRAVIEDSLGTYALGLEKESKAYINTVSNNGISSDGLLFSGGIYPSFSNNINVSHELIQSLYREYRAAQTNLNNAVTDYNQEIAKFPQSVIANCFGYQRQTFIDEENLCKSLELEVRDRIDFSALIQESASKSEQIAK